MRSYRASLIHCQTQDDALGTIKGEALGICVTAKLGYEAICSEQQRKALVIRVTVKLNYSKQPN